MAKSKRLHPSKTNARSKPKTKHPHPYAKLSPSKTQQPQKSKSKSKPSKTSSTADTTSTASSPPPLPFTPHSSILLFGEADFSYTLSLLTHHGCADLTATTLDTPAETLTKHASSAANLAAIATTGGAVIHHSIDVFNLTKGPTRNLLRRGPHEILLPDGSTETGSGYDVAVFNFPHVGGRSTDVNRQVRANQALLAAFFGGVKGLLHPTRGTVLVSLFEGVPYTLWNVRDLARSAGLRVLGSWAFYWGLYQGYGHCRTIGDIGVKDEEEERGGEGENGVDGVDGVQEKEKRKPHPDAWVGNDRPARTYAFGLKEWEGTGEEGLMKLLSGSIVPHGQGKKRKKGKGEKDSDDED